MLAGFDIAIDTLRVRARPRDAALIAADLRDGGWSVGDNADWVFIRTLSVAAPRQDLRSGASREVRAALQHCVDGSTATAAIANAVRFATLPDLLACLLRDLVQGSPPAWFWHKWQHLFRLPRAEAVTQLLWEHLAQGNAILERLAVSKALPLLWQTLTPVHARLLLTRAATLLALPPQRLLELSCARVMTNDDAYEALVNTFRHQRHDIARWQELLGNTTPDPDKVRLATTLAGLAVMPQAMVQRPEQVMRAFVQLLPVDFDFEQGRVAENAGVVMQEKQGNTSQAMLRRAADTSETRTGNRTSVAIDPLPLAAWENTVASTPNLNERIKALSVVEESAFKQSRLGEDVEGKVASLAPVEALQPDLYLTRHGGVFYLIKALDHPASYALLRDTMQWQNLQNGWTLLYQLALALGVEPDGPLQRFFAQVSGVESVAQLGENRHPALVSLLTPVLRERYVARLDWSAALLALPARIQASYSSVDVFFDTSAIRLPVRLCGLDIDPGWIPWLGRVVRFHYRDEPTLRLQHWQRESSGE